MKIVFDTSSLISLEVVKLVKKAIKDLGLEILVPDVVEDELEEMSKFKDEEGRAARRVKKLIESGKITRMSVKKREEVKKLLSTDVNIGEAECLVCCVENNIKNLIMDDVDAMYSLESWAKMKGITMKISVAVISQLVKEKKIKKKDALKQIKKISQIREWEGGVLETLAKKYFK